MPCSSKAAASLAEYSNGITRLRSSSKFSPSSAIQSLRASNCVCTACALVKVAPIPRLLTRYLRAGPRKVAVPGGRAAALDDFRKQYRSARVGLPTSEAIRGKRIARKVRADYSPVKKRSWSTHLLQPYGKREGMVVAFCYPSYPS